MALGVRYRDVFLAECLYYGCERLSTGGNSVAALNVTIDEVAPLFGDLYRNVCPANMRRSPGTRAERRYDHLECAVAARQVQRLLGRPFASLILRLNPALQQTT